MCDSSESDVMTSITNSMLEGSIFPSSDISNDYESGYKSAQCLVMRGCTKLYCPMCVKGVTQMVCQKCLLNGNLRRSCAANTDPNYMQMRVQIVRLGGVMSYNRINRKDILSVIGKNNDMKKKVNIKKSNIVKLRDAIAQIKSHTDEILAEGKKVEWCNKNDEKILDSLKRGLKNFSSSTTATKMKCAKYSDEVKEDEKLLKKVKRKCIKETLAYILPVEHVDNIKMKTPNKVQAELQKAMEDRCDSISSPSDCSSINMPVLKIAGLLLPLDTRPGYLISKDIPSPELDNAKCYSKNPDYQCVVLNSTAALSHLVQLINLLAYYEGIILPRYVSPADVINHEITENELLNLMARLEVNLIYFCLCVGVSPDIIERQNNLVKNFKTLIEHLPGRLTNRPLHIVESLFSKFQKRLKHINLKDRQRHYLPYDDTQRYEYKETYNDDFHVIQLKDVNHMHFS